MSEYEERADELERELDDMERQKERLEGEIAEVRSDWERKQADSSVPGAVDEREPEGPEPPPEHQHEDDPPPEQQYPAKGD
jgi:predicted  nucleic acid-binding Zn-ribbon protein